MPSKKLNTKGTPSQDLAAARGELKQFRRDVAILKKKGILDKKFYDARSVKPTKYLKSVLKQFANVIEGKATPVKVSKEKAAAYKKNGYTVRNGRVIVPHQETEKIYGTHGNFVRKITGKGGSIQIMDLGLDRANVLQWVEGLRNNSFKLKENEQIRFQMFGNNSYRGFSNVGNKTAQERMAEYLEFYDMFERAEEGELTPEQESDYVQGLVVFKVKRDPLTHRFPKPEPHPEDYAQYHEAKARRAQRARERYKTRAANMTGAKYEDFLNAKAQDEKERRDKMTDAQREAYKAKARERAAKAYKARKG